ncbi:MAG: hypothetical protein V1885_02875 [Candidatus Brennerbacteria bacterium]
MKPLYKILTVIGIAIVVGVVIYFLWWLFIAEPPANVPPGNGGAPTSTSTETNNSSSLSTPTVISDHTAFDYWLVPETGEVYYITPEGYVYAVKDGPDLEISRQAITALNRTEPSADGRRLLVSFGNPSSPQWAIFDTVDSVWRPLAREITNAGWGRNPNELIATVRSGNDANLSFVDISKTPLIYMVVVRDFRMEDVIFVTSKTGDTFILERPSSLFENRVWKLEPSSRALNVLFTPTQDLWIVPASTARDSFLKFTSEQGTSLLDSSFGGSVAFPFYTFPDKCAVNNMKLFCFVPKEGPPEHTDAILNSYLMQKTRSEDVFVLGSIATSTRSIEDVSSPWGSVGETTFDASRVRANENAVYFIDRYTDLLYRLELD